MNPLKGLLIIKMLLLSVSAFADKGVSGLNIGLDKATSLPMVNYVLAASPAMEAGIKNGDIILEINGESIQNATALDVSKKIDKNEGDNISLKLRRGQQVLSLNFTLINAHKMNSNRVSYIFNTTMKGKKLPDNIPVFTNYGSVFRNNNQKHYARGVVEYIGSSMFAYNTVKTSMMSSRIKLFSIYNAVGNSNKLFGFTNGYAYFVTDYSAIDVTSKGLTGSYFKVQDHNTFGETPNNLIVSTDGRILFHSGNNKGAGPYNGKIIIDVKCLGGDMMALQGGYGEDLKKRYWCTYNAIDGTYSEYKFATISSFLNGNAVASLPNGQILLIDENGNTVKKLGKMRTDYGIHDEDITGNFFMFYLGKETIFMDLQGHELFKTKDQFYKIKNIGYNIMRVEYYMSEKLPPKFLYTNGSEFNYPGLESLEPYNMGRAKIKTANGFGYLNEENRLIIPDTFINATNFNSKYNYAAVQLKSTREWLIIDTASNVLGSLGFNRDVVMDADGLFKVTKVLDGSDPSVPGPRDWDSPKGMLFADVYGYTYMEYNPKQPLNENPDYTALEHEMNALNAQIDARNKRDREEYEKNVQRRNTKTATLFDDEDDYEKQKTVKKKTEYVGTTCSACHGSGTIHSVEYGGRTTENVYRVQTRCTACSGTGQVKVRM